MNNFYSDEKNVQIILSLLKKNNISKVIASPGTTNMSLVVSMQNDSFFKVYSAVDERSAAYMACGMAAESNQPVVISCTGATASRNYLPGLTEAYYRKLPVLAITASQALSKVGHNIPQVIDRSSLPNDVANISVTLPIVKSAEDFADCEIKVNKALLALKQYGGGPAHINLPTIYSKSFEVKELPNVRKIKYICRESIFPILPKGKIAVLIGSHFSMSNDETTALDNFCRVNDAIVLCDHTSGYYGDFRVLHSLLSSQILIEHIDTRPDLLIHIGGVTGDYSVNNVIGKEVWRVCEDGRIVDTFGKLTYIFDMPENKFFEYYSDGNIKKMNNLDFWNSKLNLLRGKLPKLPFSNVWIASKMANKLPKNSVIHFGILNSLRTWNFFELPHTVNSACNVGGFGIDGVLSTVLGASLINKDKLYYCVIGDLAFFYDMNAIGNRHIGKNIRILLVNNGKGTEFRQFNHPGAAFGEQADDYIAAARHFGNQSRSLVKHYAQDLGFDYLSAASKNEFESVYNDFLSPDISDRPILFEVFTDSKDESEALELIMSIEKQKSKQVKKALKNFLGERKVQSGKKIISKFKESR